MANGATEQGTLRQIGRYRECAKQYGREHVVERWANPQGGIFEIEHNDKSTMYPYVVNAYFGRTAAYGWYHGKTLAEARIAIVGR